MGGFKLYFNTSIYDGIDLPFSYHITKNIIEADFAVTCVKPLRIPKNSKVKFVVCPCTNSDHVEVLNDALVIDLKQFKNQITDITSTVEHTLFLILYLLKRNSLGNERNQFSGHLISKDVGVIGNGRIGSQIIKILDNMGCWVLAYDINFKSNEMKNLLLSRSDIITIHVSVNKKSKPVLDRESFSLIKDGAYIINTSRGKAIDEEALLENVDRLGGVALDVVDGYKHVEELKKKSNVIITPHYGGYTKEDITRTYMLCMNKLKEEM